MTNAEANAAVANAGQTRTAADFDEIVIDGVSIPVRSIQRTDTSRFEGKVTFGDYTVDSDQLMSTWAQSSWVGGMNVADHIEGATDGRFRYARAWTMSPRQMTLPLHTRTITLGSTASADNAADQIVAIIAATVGAGSGTGLPYNPHLWDDLATMPLGARHETIYAACGLELSAINGETYAVTSIGDLSFLPTGPGAWFDDGAGDLVLWIPMGTHGIQHYDPVDNAIGAVDSTVKAVAVRTWDKRLFAVTRSTLGTDATFRLRYFDLTGAWDAGTNDDLKIPADEIPINLVEFFDRAGNSALCIVTNRQVWYYNPDADAITPLGFRYPFSRTAALASAMWRDDGLYVSHGLGVNRISQSGVRTAVGLDRDDGWQVGALGDGYTETWGTNPTIYAMTGSENMLVAAVSGFTASGTTHHELVGWNEAGWHHIANAFADGSGQTFVPNGLIVADGLDTYQLVMGERAKGLDTPADTPKLYITKIPEDFHAPKASVLAQPVEFASTGRWYSGWIDAGMINFYKAWSQVEVYLKDPDDGTLAPPGSVEVFYRTEDDPTTWTSLGTATAYGQNTLQFNVVSGVSRGIDTRRIELKAVITHEDSPSAPHTDSPVIEAISLKFVKLAQYGSAWIVNVPLSDFDTEVGWQGNGPEQIDTFLANLTARGAETGPFSAMLHGYDEDGSPATYRVRAAQWQRAELPGKAPWGDGVLNLIVVPVQQVDPA